MYINVCLHKEVMEMRLRILGEYGCEAGAVVAACICRLDLN